MYKCGNTLKYYIIMYNILNIINTYEENERREKLKMEKDKKNYGKSILVVLLLLITMVALVFATYAWARYTSTASGNVQASIARWDVTLSTDTSKFVRQYQHVVTDKMAPGTEGQIDIALAANDTDVNFDFELALNDITNLNNKPAHVRFYKDSSKSAEITSSNDLIKGRVIVVNPATGHRYVDDGLSPKIEMANAFDNNGNPTGYAAATDLSSSANLSIYWDWAYDYETYGGKVLDATHTNHTKLASNDAGYADAVAAYDEQDTQDAKDFNLTLAASGTTGNYANNTAYNTAAKSMVVNFTLTATQTRPSPTTYPTSNS